LAALRFSRAQFGIQLGCYEGILEVSRRGQNLRKYLWDEALELVPGGGIEPSTYGFSVPPSPISPTHYRHNISVQTPVIIGCPKDLRIVHIVHAVTHYPRNYPIVPTPYPAPGSPPRNESQAIQAHSHIRTQTPTAMRGTPICFELISEVSKF